MFDKGINLNKVGRNYYIEHLFSECIISP